MQKTTIKLLALALCLTLVLSLAACGGSGNSSTAGSGSSTVSTPEEPSSAADTSDDEQSSSGLMSTVEEFLQTDEFATMYDEMKESVKDSGMSIEVTGEGSMMIYRFTYDNFDELGVEPEVLGAALEEAADELEESMCSVASALATLGIPDPVVRVIYDTPDGTELLSRDFTAN